MQDTPPHMEKKPAIALRISRKYTYRWYVRLQDNNLTNSRISTWKCKEKFLGTENGFRWKLNIHPYLHFEINSKFPYRIIAVNGMGGRGRIWWKGNEHNWNDKKCGRWRIEAKKKSWCHIARTMQMHLLWAFLHSPNTHTRNSANIHSFSINCPYIGTNWIKFNIL